MTWHMRLFGLSLIALALGGCVNSLGTHMVTGQARPSTSASDVVLYATMPQGAVVIGQVASRSTIFSSEQEKTDEAVKRLKQEAAEVGANGILLQVYPPVPFGKKPGTLVPPDKIGVFVTHQNHDALINGEAIYVPGQAP